MGLSKREQTTQELTGVSSETLKWSEGSKLWVINESDKWVQAMRKLSLPLAAGPSGTTNALMNASAMLGGDPSETRMACIGYLLPIKAHSLVEICAAAAGHGVGFNAGKQMYRELPPLTKEELQACGRDNPAGGAKLFPDEPDPAQDAAAGAPTTGAPTTGAA